MYSKKGHIVLIRKLTLDSDENIQKLLDSIGTDEILGVGVQQWIWKNREHKVIKRVPQVQSSVMKSDYLCIMFGWITNSFIATLTLRFVFGKGWELKEHEIISRNAS